MPLGCLPLLSGRASVLSDDVLTLDVRAATFDDGDPVDRPSSSLVGVLVPVGVEVRVSLWGVVSPTRVVFVRLSPLIEVSPRIPMPVCKRPAGLPSRGRMSPGPTTSPPVGTFSAESVDDLVTLPGVSSPWRVVSARVPPLAEVSPRAPAFSCSCGTVLSPHPWVPDVASWGVSLVVGSPRDGELSPVRQAGIGVSSRAWGFSLRLRRGFCNVDCVGRWITSRRLTVFCHMVTSPRGVVAPVSPTATPLGVIPLSGASAVSSLEFVVVGW